ncbi:hypothetical protein FCIRC_11994 [Fusarium circinatum]|uniref:Uncharacterized protein n=1 Tax=Fusarium circinatum TaxID=48490 RepID=A0A8H5T188_FUSCI|nr:hypothetical protein FCIRC_11994 [Fusarium circinatum]
MDNKTHVKTDSLSIEDLARQMRRPIIMTPTGPMPPGDASTLQKVAELKATAIIAGDLLCGLRFESPSGETGNMIAPSNLVKDAVIYQGNDAGLPAAIESAVLGHRKSGIIDTIPLPITSKGLMESKLPAGYRKSEIKLSFVDRSEVTSQTKGNTYIQDCEYDKAIIIFPYDEALLGPQATKALMLEEVVDGGEGTGACWVVERSKGPFEV